MFSLFYFLKIIIRTIIECFLTLFWKHKITTHEYYWVEYQRLILFNSSILIEMQSLKPPIYIPTKASSIQGALSSLCNIIKSMIGYQFKGVTSICKILSGVASTCFDIQNNIKIDWFLIRKNARLLRLFILMMVLKLPILEKFISKTQFFFKWFLRQHFKVSYS